MEIDQIEGQYKNRVKTYILLGGIALLLLLTGILYRNNKQKQKAKVKIEKAYEELKVTLAQLIESEKMTSLGELTAGIGAKKLRFLKSEIDANSFICTREKITESVKSTGIQ